MRLVVDTNVLVSALLHPGRRPDRALAAIRERRDVVLFDERLVAEWREVIARPKFRSIDAGRGGALVDALVAAGELVVVPTPFAGELVDADDRAFVEVALAGLADAIVTGNARHYPTGLGFDVLGPAALLDRFEAS
jgi:putative PIN family toxin of toxin-antitoxin system